MSIYLIEGDSKTYDEAMISIDVIFLKEAIKRELDSIVSNHTWGLYGLPEGCKAISSKWILRRNWDMIVQLIKIKLDLWLGVLTKRKLFLWQGRCNNREQAELSIPPLTVRNEIWEKKKLFCL